MKKNIYYSIYRGRGGTRAFEAHSPELSSTELVEIIYDHFNHMDLLLDCYNDGHIQGLISSEFNEKSFIEHMKKLNFNIIREEKEDIKDL